MCEQTKAILPAQGHKRGQTGTSENAVFDGEADLPACATRWLSGCLSDGGSGGSGNRGSHTGGGRGGDRPRGIKRGRPL